MSIVNETSTKVYAMWTIDHASETYCAMDRSAAAIVVSASVCSSACGTDSTAVTLRRVMPKVRLASCAPSVSMPKMRWKPSTSGLRPKPQQTGKRCSRHTV